MSTIVRRLTVGATALAAIALSIAPAIAQGTTRPSAPGGAAVDAIRAAVRQRVGAAADVEISDLQLLGAVLPFASARPDPAGMLGRPVRFSLVPATGSWVPAVARITVVVEHARTRRAVARGEVIAAEDVEAVTASVTDVPLRPLPTAAAVAGARALRAIPAGAIVQAGAVVIRRAIEPGDRVTALATIGEIEVSATFVAADGGRPGDVIRVVNPETRRYIRGRVIRPGLVEVLYGR